MTTAEIMRQVVDAKKYLVSNGQPKFLGECAWLDTYFMQFFAHKSSISQAQKEKLRQLVPLDLPVTSMTLNCPIEGRQISFALHYFYIDGWVINSATIHYICAHDVFVPDSLVKAICAV